MNDRVYEAAAGSLRPKRDSGKTHAKDRISRRGKAVGTDFELCRKYLTLANTANAQRMLSDLDRIPMDHVVCTIKGTRPRRLLFEVPPGSQVSIERVAAT